MGSREFEVEGGQSPMWLTERSLPLGGGAAAHGHPGLAAQGLVAQDGAGDGAGDGAEDGAGDGRRAPSGGPEVAAAGGGGGGGDGGVDARGGQLRLRLQEAQRERREEVESRGEVEARAAELEERLAAAEATLTG